MKINYGVNKREPRGKSHRKRKFIHKNGKLDLPQYNDDDWEYEKVHRSIREIILAENPGWSITGYALSSPHQPTGKD